MQLTKHLLRIYPLAIALIGDASATKNSHCPPLGPVLPAPTSPSSHPAVKSAVSGFQEIFNGFTSAFNNTAVSIGLKSLHETTPIVDVHYTPPVLDPRGASAINASTIYRIGSVSKVFTVLAALKTSGVRMDDPITKYLPRLRELNEQQNGSRDQITTVDWDDITLQALASHMGGIGSDLVTDLTSFPVDWTKFGLPKAREVLGCVGFAGIRPCNATEFWDNFGKRAPVFSPYSSPLYSNTAFFILSLVIESVSGQSYEDFVQQHILDTVGMPGTSYNKKPDDKLGAISLNDTTWDASLGIEDPAGSYYSNTRDLLAFGEAILTNKLLSPIQTKRWLKPVTFTSSTGILLGAPWEILRAENITSDERLIEFYTKEGDVGAYHAILALITDYDLVLSILTSGPEASAPVVQMLASQTISALLPAIETAGKDDAQSAFAGTYVDEESDSSLTLILDDEGPGFKIEKWIVRGADVSKYWLGYLSSMSDSLPQLNLSMRLYPTGLARRQQGGLESWS
ncbi:hypothetical protein M426DRAFT_325739 [Hypoxylon sp. CI-4A]|nr:hypothetical protein M426DRAFT_325739 [Hypoxylon sp. CI-4A]